MKKFILLIIFALTLSACEAGPSVSVVVEDNGNAIYTMSGVTDYGNNVYYFPENEFGTSLSTFLSMHPELEVVAIAGKDTGGYGFTVGYYVAFRLRESAKVEGKLSGFLYDRGQLFNSYILIFYSYLKNRMENTNLFLTAK